LRPFLDDLAHYGVEGERLAILDLRLSVGKNGSFRRFARVHPTGDATREGEGGDAREDEMGSVHGASGWTDESVEERTEILDYV